MRILITGAAGLSATPWLHSWSSRGHKVMGLTRSRASVLPTGVHRLDGDLCIPRPAKIARRRCQPGSWRAYNVGSGRSSTVQDVIATTEKVTGRPIPRRRAAAQVPATLWSTAPVSNPNGGWRPQESTLPEIITDAWTALNSD